MAELERQEAACHAADRIVAESRIAIAKLQADIAAKRASLLGALDTRRSCKAEIKRIKRELRAR